MGRKKLNEEARRVVSVRLSKREYEKLKFDAKIFSMTPSSCIRRLIMHNGEYDFSAEKDRREIIKQLAAIGNNINQVAHRVNANGFTTSGDLMEIKGLLSELCQTAKDIYERPNERKEVAEDGNNENMGDRGI